MSEKVTTSAESATRSSASFCKYLPGISSYHTGQGVCPKCNASELHRNARNMVCWYCSSEMLETIALLVFVVASHGWVPKGVVKDPPISPLLYPLYSTGWFKQKKTNRHQRMPHAADTRMPNAHVFSIMLTAMNSGRG